MGLFQRIFVVVALCVAVSHQQTCQLTSNQDVAPGSDIGHQVGQPIGNCCGICNNTPGCRAFSWNNHEGGTCWLKGATTPVVFADGVTSGILSGGGGGALVSWDEFVAAVTINMYPAPQFIQYTTFVDGLPYGLITTRQEAAMALVQFMHESDGLRARREYACEHTGCPGHYETPGCDVAGQRYFGRGYIQLTWCGYNYRPFSIDYFGDDRLRFTPDLVASDDSLAWNSAFWFWRINVHNFAGVQQGHFGATTRAINGNLECNNPDGHHLARRRFEMYGRVRSVWGLPGPGIEYGCYN